MRDAGLDAFLVINDANRAAVKRVLAWARSHERDVYAPTSTPAYDPRFVAMVGGYRTCFTFTRSGDNLFRHLSVSVPPAARYPSPLMLWTIADLFEFTGWSRDTLGDQPAPEWRVRLQDDTALVMQLVI